MLENFEDGGGERKEKEREEGGHMCEQGHSGHGIHQNFF